MSARSITVLKPGLETCVQELPGRIGFLEQGFPISGPFDKWSFRQANLLVGNARDAAALECQMIGPSLRFDAPARIAVTGADMTPKIDGAPMPMWQGIDVVPGQVLSLSVAREGMRAYIAVSGAVATTPVLGSRAVFHMAGVGGAAINMDDVLPIGEATNLGAIMQVSERARPVIASDGNWRVEALAGPNDDWLSPEAVETFFSSDWAVQARSNRTGIRLTGPEFTFASRATEKSSDHGHDPSNIIDHGYPLGAVNLAGQTPIILVNDSPSTGGFINPFTVASAAFWKLAQMRPDETLRFERVDRARAGELRAEIDRLTSSEVLEHA